MTTILEQSTSWHPQCYFRNEDLLVLEDLGHEGYEHATNKRQFSVEQCKATLDTIATMHAASFAYEQNALNGLSLQTEFANLLSETSFVPSNTWFVVGLEVTLIISLYKITIKMYIILFI